MAPSSEPPSLFALLTPDNIEALKAFSKVFEATVNDPSRFFYHQSFITANPTPTPLRCHLRAASSSTDSDLDTKTSEELETLIWTGSYMFSLGILPEKVPTTWRAGSGRWSREPQGEIDFLLSLETPEDRVRGNHASFQFDKKTGLLMLGAYHSGLHAVKLGTETFGKSDGQRALNAHSTIIQFGRLEYKFAYQIDSNTPLEIEHQKLKERYFRTTLHSPPPLEATSATPSTLNVTLGRWTLHRPMGVGTFGVVSAASHHTGEVVAVKTFLRQDRRSSMEPDKELDIAQKVTAYDPDERKKYLIQFKEVIYSSGSATFQENRPDYIYILYTPLARGDFRKELLGASKPIALDVTITLFAHILRGIEFLHSKGWMHRDLKPGNMGIVSLDPPHAVVFDLGQALEFDPKDVDSEDTSRPGFIPATPGRLGTVLYLAPEMETKDYHEKVDMWALGVVAHEIFLGYHPWKFSFNPWIQQGTEVTEKYKTTFNGLCDKPQDSIENLIIKGMLHFNMNVRLSAAAAVRHPVILRHTLRDAAQPPKRPLES